MSSLEEFSIFIALGIALIPGLLALVLALELYKFV
uniref:Photosystem I reaction center subunit XII n=1 Tax=Gloeochaete wittrockiana TaxID=38269 RepID=A0A3G1IW35_9EUKA|nr:photosystem I subunit M [Gloeochaete wittrockiana]ASQ40276.1 photosystem I subunit M [Gloeochaete wittrockiana]